MRISLFARLYGTFALIVLSSAALVWWIASIRVEDQALATLVEVLKARTAIIEQTGVDPGQAGDQGITDMGLASETRITLIAADGTVTGDSAKDPADMENHARRPEILSASQRRQPASFTRFSQTLGRDMMYLARPVYRDGQLVGYIRAALPLTLVDSRLGDVWTNVAIGAGASLLFALILGLFFARQFTRPLAYMTRAAAGIASGRHQRIRAFRRRDELGELAEALESMSVQLDERMTSLSRERNQLRAVLASMLEGVVAVDIEERVVHMNYVAARLLGSPEDSAAGKRFGELVRVQEIADLLREVLADAVDRTREIRISGVPRDRLIEVHASPLRGSEDEVAGAVMVLFDVTELRHLETVRREFVANVSHELKTPLTAIRGFIETILDDDQAEESVKRRFLERARDQALRISTLVNDLLVLSRVESDPGTLESVPIDLRETVASSARRVAPDIRGRSVTFETEVPHDQVSVIGDEEALRQAVDNLLDNAFKYTPDGGVVRLALRIEAATAVIQVSDTGIGIEEPHLARIFERFYRVDKARSRAMGGTGLGLSIVKHIAESHRGSVSVSSVPGEGSLFRITLPIRTA